MFLNSLKKVFKYDKTIYTPYLVLSSISYGFLFTLFPNILVDMKYILNTSMGLISLYTSAETVGYILGTLVGLTYKYLNRQLVVGVVYTLLTIACTTIPLVTNLWLLYFCGFVFGFGSSAYVSACTVWTMDMWGSKARSFLYLNDFSFAIGNILCTLILKPHLVGELHDKNELVLNSIEKFKFNMILSNGTEPAEIDRRASIMWPCIYIGICILPVPLYTLIMYFIKPYKTHEIQTKQTNEDLITEETKLFDRPETPRKTMRILCAFWYTMYVIFETVFLKFAVTYFQYCPQKMTAQEAAHLFSISTIVYAVFRGLNGLISLKIQILYMLSYHYVVLIIGTILLVIGQNNLTILWIASIFLSLGFSAMFAGIYSYTGQQLTMTNQLNTCFLLIRGLFTLFTPIVIGEYMEDYSEIFIFVEIFYLSTSLVFFVLINYMIRKYTLILDKKQIKV